MNSVILGEDFYHLDKRIYKLSYLQDYKVFINKYSPKNIDTSCFCKIESYGAAWDYECARAGCK
jgi:hypothetical protein